MLLNGCLTTWKPREVAPAQLLEATGETEVQVRLVDGRRMVLRDPGIEGDSLIGWQAANDARAGAAPVRQAFALSDVEHLATRGNNVAPNVILGAATGFAAFVASVAAIFVIVCWSGCD